MTAISEADLAYTAGFMDGEGCFYLGFRFAAKGRRCFPCTVTVSQTSQEVLRKLHSLFGGKLYPVKIHGVGKRPVWTWSIYGTEADRMIVAILPYLVVKKRDAEIFMEMRALINDNPMGKRITSEGMIKRLALVNSLKDIHQGIM